MGAVAADAGVVGVGGVVRQVIATMAKVVAMELAVMGEAIEIRRGRTGTRQAEETTIVREVMIRRLQGPEVRVSETASRVSK